MQLAANVNSGNDLDWHAIEWKRIYRIVKNLRRRIFRASRESNCSNGKMVSVPSVISIRSMARKPTSIM
jgi:RNA-directed DNA polymerase